MPDVLVLGADGFIGSHLCDALLERGLPIRAFDRHADGRSPSLDEPDRFERFVGDFLDPVAIERAVTGVRFVVHLVSTTTPASSVADPANDVATNLLGSIRLFESCERAGVERIVFASSGGAIYGHDPGRPLVEGDLTSPISPYAVGKLAIEGYLRYFRASRGLDSMVLRISNPFGERQPFDGAQGAVPIFARHLLHDEPITVFGDGSMVRDYLYVGDLAAAIAKVIEAPAAHHIYNVSSGTRLSVIELIERVADACDASPRIEHRPHRPSDVHRVALDASRFEGEFGPIATTSFDESLRRAVDDVRARLAVPTLVTGAREA